MAEKQLCELNHRHMALAEYILTNPSARLPEIAAAVGLSPSWVSVVTNSQLFREYLQTRNREISEVVHLSLQEKVAGIAHRAVEKLGEAIDNSQDPAFLLAAADRTLGRLGYGAKAATQVNVNNRGPSPAPTPPVSITIISEAREKMYALAGKADPNAPGLPSAGQFQACEQHRGSTLTSEAASVYPSEEAAGAQGPGRAIREEGFGPPRQHTLPAPVAEPMD